MLSSLTGILQLITASPGDASSGSFFTNFNFDNKTALLLGE